ncbi:MAG: polyprenyl synthetase family protein [Candidatus Krumholzibacteriota bacterium]|nr:polyprenyl synthetase family protein [Candidatus Krumholzibacteriota bacterium]
MIPVFMEISHNQTLEMLRAPVKRELDLLEKLFRASLHSEMPLMEEICELLKRVPGKRLRPNILLLASKSAGSIPEDAITAGVAIELIHTATLVHDDIIDKHKVRRGRPTIYSQWGTEIATIVGDFLYSKSIACLGEESLFEVMEILARACNIMSLGEMMQFQQSRNIYLSERGYMELIFRKTASLVSAASECGAIVGSGDRKYEYRSNFSLFGENVGLAFQITDDLFDYLAVDERIGKPIASDFTEGRVTLPFIAAFRNAPEMKKRRVSELFLVDFKKDMHWDEVVTFVQNYGGVEYSMRKARELGESAKSSLANIEPSLEKDALSLAADYVVRRIDGISS